MDDLTAVPPPNDESGEAPDTADNEAPPAVEREPYRHDPSMVSELVALADAACEPPGARHEIQRRIAGLAPTVAPTVGATAVRTLSETFGYRIQLDRGKAGSPDAELEPLNQPRGFSWPPAIRSASDDVRQLWVSLSTEVTHPAARSLLFDLRFAAGRLGNGRDNAEQAVQAHLELVDSGLHRLDQSVGLVRAWTLSRKVGLAALETDVVEAMKRLIANELATAEGESAGVVLPLLTALVQPPARSTIRDPEVDRLLDLAFARYRSRSYLATQVANLVRLYATDDQRKEAVNRAEAEVYLSAAEETSENLPRMGLLQDAAVVARRLGVKDIEDRARAAMQAIRPEDLEWIRHPFSVKLPPDIVEQRLRIFDEAPDWRHAIGMWLETDPPTGRFSNNEQAARERLTDSVIRRILPTVVFGTHGLPQSTIAADDDSQLGREIVHGEEINAMVDGGMLASALERISATYGTPTQAELEIFFSGQFGCDPRLGKSLATALRLFWMGELDASVHLAIPKIEAAARGLLLLIDEPLYNVEQGKSPGKFPPLEFLLRTLEAQALDLDWARFLGTFLTLRGRNYRNFAAHGFIHEVSRTDAALTLRALGLLTLINPNDASARDAAVVRQALVRPARRRPRSWHRRAGDAIRAAVWEYRKEPR